MTTPTTTLGWRFPAVFWYSNGAELFERAAYYGVFITIFRYLNLEVGFSDLEPGYIMGGFTGMRARIVRAAPRHGGQLSPFAKLGGCRRILFC